MNGRWVGESPATPRSLGCSRSEVMSRCLSGSVRDVVRRQDEDLADHVRVLLIAGHEADNSATGGLLDDLLEALAHDVLEGHALADDVLAVAALEERLLNTGEAATQQADDEIVADVGLGSLRAAAVELLQQGDEAVRDRGAHVSGG